MSYPLPKSILSTLTKRNAVIHHVFEALNCVSPSNRGMVSCTVQQRGPNHTVGGRCVPHAPLPPLLLLRGPQCRFKHGFKHGVKKGSDLHNLDELDHVNDREAATERRVKAKEKPTLRKGKKGSESSDTLTSSLNTTDMPDDENEGDEERTRIV